MKLLFVGERPSHRAAKIGATWQNGKLAAKQLHDALRALNIDPAKHEYINLWTTPDTYTEDDADLCVALERIAYFVGRKTKSDLSSKTNPEKLDQAREALRAQVRAL